MARTNIRGTLFGETSRMSMGQDQFTDMIRRKAYELYEKRGRKPGHAMEDWLEAERIVRQKRF